MNIENQIAHQEQIIGMSESLLFALDQLDFSENYKNHLLDNLVFAYAILKTLKETKQQKNEICLEDVEANQK